MDWRILVVLLPVLIAAGWAGFNVFAVAFDQAQKFLKSRA
ncbi:MAG: photosystem II protein Y [Spirulinaceae cyanobacterium RM2_2_10]|nr:photosystem II protein Y [Spirulinaceae cyanobacterium SM2_1_0]NJO20549.1 photosystem II protein Y [Spirulinaceae cyanobacterium RM2_2_10]